MAPEAKRIFGVARETLERGLGVSEHDIQLLRERAIDAVTANDFEALREIIERLEKASSLKSDLEGTTDPFQAILEKHGLLDADIDLGQFSETRLSLTREPMAPLETRAKRRRWKEDKYVLVAPAAIATALIAKNQRGGFRYKSLDKVVSVSLQPGRNTEKDFADAKGRYSNAVSSLADSLESVSRATGAKTVSSVVGKLLDEKVAGNLNNPYWVDFYKYARKTYGSVDISDFVENVLQRFYTRDEKKEAKAERTARRKNTEKKAEVIPTQITPVHELVLCNRLTFGGGLTRIKDELLGGAEPQIVAEKHGWPKGEPLVEALEVTRLEMANLRKGEVITNQEAEASARIIRSVLESMAVSRRGWHNLDKRYKGFRLLFTVMAEVRKTHNVADKILKLLYPAKVFQIDGTSGLVVPGVEI